MVDSYCVMVNDNKSHPKFSCTKFFNALLSGMNILIEQNDNLWLNKSQVSCVYWISCALLLSGIIFSNLYRGNNISAISAPLKEQPLKSPDELDRLNYILLSRLHDKGAERLKYFLKTKPNFSRLSSFSEVGCYSAGCDWSLGIVPLHPLPKQIRRRIQCHDVEVSALVQNQLQNYSALGILTKCNGVGLFGWKTRLEPFERVLLTMKGPRGESTIISSGMNQVEDTAVFFVRYTGWAIYPWLNPNIFRRIGALQFSGIPES